MRQLIHSKQLAGHRAVVVGAGVSGMAALRLLAHLGARVALADKNASALPESVKNEIESLGGRLLQGDDVPAHYATADLVVASPGVPTRKIPALAALPAGKLLAELELASWFVAEPVIAVTGSSGKTTTVHLIEAALKGIGKTVFLGGNVGTPLSEYVLNGVEGTNGSRPADVLVLEVSSFQLQNCRSFRPQVGVLLNVASNHLDYHADMAEYLDAKLNLFARQRAEDMAILPLTMREDLKGRAFTKAVTVWYGPSGRFSSGRLLGRHNLENIEAAYLAASAFGVDEAAMQRAVDAFAPLKHRLEPVAAENETGGVLFVNDSKSTTIDSMRAALESFDRPVRLLAGGVFKGGEPRELLPVMRGRVVAVELFGAGREVFEPAFAPEFPTRWSATLEEAVGHAAREAAPGDAVLLSPGTASFDLFANYKERGEAFRRAVTSLAGKAGERAKTQEGEGA